MCGPAESGGETLIRAPLTVESEALIRLSLDVETLPLDAERLPRTITAEQPS